MNHIERTPFTFRFMIGGMAILAMLSAGCVTTPDGYSLPVEFFFGSLAHRPAHVSKQDAHPPERYRNGWSNGQYWTASAEKQAGRNRDAGRFHGNMNPYEVLNGNAPGNRQQWQNVSDPRQEIQQVAFQGEVDSYGELQDNLQAHQASRQTAGMRQDANQANGPVRQSMTNHSPRFDDPTYSPPPVNRQRIDELINGQLPELSQNSLRSNSTPQQHLNVPQQAAPLHSQNAGALTNQPSEMIQMQGTHFNRTPVMASEYALHLLDEVKRLKKQIESNEKDARGKDLVINSLKQKIDMQEQTIAKINDEKSKLEVERNEYLASLRVVQTEKLELQRKTDETLDQIESNLNTVLLKTVSQLGEPPSNGK